MKCFGRRGAASPCFEGLVCYVFCPAAVLRVSGECLLRAKGSVIGVNYLTIKKKKRILLI
jgi:hypothetical protein